METGSESSRPDPALLAAATSTERRPIDPPTDRPIDRPIEGSTDWRAEARDLWECVATLSIRFPSIAKVYTPERLDRLAAAWAPVLHRHNLTFGKFAIYFVAGTATLPVVGLTYQAIRDDRVAERAAAEAASKASTEARPIDRSVG